MCVRPIIDAVDTEDAIARVMDNFSKPSLYLFSWLPAATLYILSLFN